MPLEIKSQLLVPQLVAHRGYSVQYPENTLLSIEQAFIAGACFVECDVQLTLDSVPVVLHDVTLQRTCGQSANITELNWAQLENISAHYATRFGERHGKILLPSLAQLLTLMERWPQRQVFVELKRTSIRKFGIDNVFNAIVNTTGRASGQVIAISFDYDIIERIRRETALRTGWVIEEWSDANLVLAEQLAPDYVFVDYECIPDNLAKLPDAKWRWVLYEIDDVVTALVWVKKGASYIETNNVGGMLLTPEFTESRCDD
ncbi:glycerophosphodiester phosphodiesterase family protein [Kaarinaea lacus]